MLRTPPGPDRVPRALLALLLGAAILCLPETARAESAAAAGGTRGSARLMFKIVIPSLLVMDSRTGTMYSNDRKVVAQLGVLDVREMREVPRTAWTVVAAPATNLVGPARATALRAVAGGGISGPLQRERGAVLCIP